jgi:hypothetical protein
VKCDNSLDKLQIIVTDYGYRIEGWKESILPLGRLARVKYKKKLKTKRLIKKYAKKLLSDAISNFIKGEYAKPKENGTEYPQERW